MTLLIAGALIWVSGWWAGALTAAWWLGAFAPTPVPEPLALRQARRIANKEDSWT